MQSTSLSMTDYSLLDDAALAKEALHDAEAFSVLYRRYVTPLYRYLYRRVGNVKDAEDLTAQVFTDLLEGLASYRENGRFASWLFTILDGSNRRLVAQMDVNDGYFNQPIWPPDGKWLAMKLDANTTNAAPIEGGMALINLETCQIIPLTGWILSHGFHKAHGSTETPELS